MGVSRRGVVVSRGVVEEVDVNCGGLEEEFWLGELINAEDAPQWIRTPGIVRGYRRAPRTWRGCWRTIFNLHNETVNIWSHVVAAVWTVYMFADVIGRRLVGCGDAVFELAMGLMISCAVICYIASVMFHACAYQSKTMYKKMLKLDQNGILAHITSSHAGAFSFLLRNWPRLRLGVLAFTGVAFYILQYVTNVLQSDPVPKRRNRLFLFAVLWAPFLVFFPMCYIDPALSLKFTKVWVPSYCLNFFAAGIFFSRLPETRFPGKFDMFLNSHQFWHFFIPLSFTHWTYGLTALYQEVAADVVVAEVSKAVPVTSYIIATAAVVGSFFV